MSGSKEKMLTLNLKIWRQNGPEDKGRFMEYTAKGISTEMSFLEMLDVVNEGLINTGKSPIVFDHDCREGICGMCSMVINGAPHGPEKSVATCQLHMRSFKDGDTLVVEPFRAQAFPSVRDLAVDRSALDRVQQAGGFISVNVGNAPDANAVSVGKSVADRAFDAATCIGCGACVAACKNASANLFVSAKLAHLNILPQGQPEKLGRTKAMVAQMDLEGFGACTNTGACSAACPKDINMDYISLMNRDFASAHLKDR